MIDLSIYVKYMCIMSNNRMDIYIYNYYYYSKYICSMYIYIYSIIPMGFLGYTQTTYPAPHWSWSWCRNPGDTSLKVHHFRTGTRWNHGGFPWLFVLLEGKYMICLVVWNMWYFPYIGNVIIPTDEFICFRGVPPTSDNLIVIPWSSSKFA